jgi:hypothetical protein
LVLFLSLVFGQTQSQTDKEEEEQSTYSAFLGTVRDAGSAWNMVSATVIGNARGVVSGLTALASGDSVEAAAANVADGVIGAMDLVIPGKQLPSIVDAIAGFLTRAHRN